MAQFLCLVSYLLLCCRCARGLVLPNPKVIPQCLPASTGLARYALGCRKVWMMLKKSKHTE